MNNKKDVPIKCTECGHEINEYLTLKEGTDICTTCSFRREWKEEREGSILLKEIRVPIDDEEVARE